ncbi:Pre-protein VI [Dirofilaria immitis]
MLILSHQTQTDNAQSALIRQLNDGICYRNRRICCRIKKSEVISESELFDRRKAQRLVVAAEPILRQNECESDARK